MQCYFFKKCIIYKQAQPLANELCPNGRAWVMCWGVLFCAIDYPHNFARGGYPTGHCLLARMTNPTGLRPVGLMLYCM